MKASLSNEFSGFVGCKRERFSLPASLSFANFASARAPFDISLERLRKFHHAARRKSSPTSRTPSRHFIRDLSCPATTDHQ